MASVDDSAQPLEHSHVPEKRWPCLLHIGQAKTGTSSIARFMHEHRAKLLSDHGVLYPKAGIAGHSQA